MGARAGKQFFDCNTGTAKPRLTQSCVHARGGMTDDVRTAKLQAMHPSIAQHSVGISAICQRYGIQRLEVFGSAARGNDFNPSSSDADFWSSLRRVCNRA
jgi:hypothetical protein